MEYYESRTKRLLAQFDSTVGRVSDLFANGHGPSDAAAMVREARAVYRALIPDLPYVGGAQPLTQFVVATGWFLAMKKVTIRPV